MSPRCSIILKSAASSYDIILICVDFHTFILSAGFRRRGIFAFPFRCASLLFDSVSGPVVAIRCHSAAYLSTAVPLLRLSLRFDSLRCLSVAALSVAFPCLCCACPCFAIPYRFCAMPIIAIRFLCFSKRG